MKLWPFSKKPVNSVSESHFELPPGVMLASPDEAGFEAQAAPTPGRYDAMHADEHAAAPEQHEAPPAPTVEAKPDLPQFAEQNQLEFISQQPAEPLQQPTDMHHAPATKAELYQEINASLTSLYNPAAQEPEAPASPKPEVLPEQTLDELLSQPVPSPQSNIAHIDFGLPPKQENANQDGTLLDIGNSIEADIDLDAILYGPAANEPEPTSPLNVSDLASLDFLAPPPVNSVEEPSATALYPPPAIEANISEELFYLPPVEPFGPIDSLEENAREGQAIELTSPLCDLSEDFTVTEPVQDLFAADELQQMADFLGADFLPQTEPLTTLQDSYPTAADIPAAQLQEDATADMAGYLQPEPYPTAEYDEQEPKIDFETGTPNLDKPSETFSTMSLGSFTEFSMPDTLFQPDSLFRQAETFSADLPATSTEEPLAGAVSETYHQPQYTPDQAPDTLYETADSAASPESIAEERYDASYEADYDATDGSDFDSYDLGHYDDPDQPAEAFVLSEDTPSAPEIQALDSTHSHCEEPATDLQAMARFLATEVAENEPNEHTSANSPDNAACALDVDTSEYEEAALPDDMPPMAQEHPPANAGQNNQAEPPKPYREAAAIQPFQPAATKNNAAPKQAQPYCPQPRRLYNDSVTEALEGFQEEMLLEDSRFLRNSINNLVDSYFANRKPESSP